MRRGAAAPKSVIKAFEQKHNVPFIHAYGMTETSPLVTLARLKSYETELSYEEQLEIRSKQGYLVPGVEMKVVGTNGEVKWDGTEMGNYVYERHGSLKAIITMSVLSKVFAMGGYILVMLSQWTRKAA